MPVTDVHPEYTEHIEQWRRCRDAFDGQDAIKKRGEVYLPKPGGLEAKDPRYTSYKTRAKWFNATARTVDGLEGEVFRNDPQTEVPDQVEDLFSDLTLTGMSHTSVSRDIMRERLILGRCGELVEFSEDLRRPYSVVYAAEAIINWHTEIMDGQQKLVLVVLKEQVRMPGTDDFSFETKDQYRVLRFFEGTYIVEVFREQSRDGKTVFEVVERRTPTIQEQPMDFIPFQFYGVNENSPTIEKPPLLDLVDVNISDYRNSADLEHGRHFCGLPQHWRAGFGDDPEDDSAIPIGSGEVWVAEDPDAKAGIIEFSGQGLQALEKAREENRLEMALLGARLLEEPKRVGETAEAIARRQAGKLSILQAMTEIQSEGQTKTLEWMTRWMGLGEQEASVQLNKDFTAARLDPTAMRELVAAWQSGAISKETLFHNLQQGEIVAPDRTFEDEQAAISEEAPLFEVETEAAG